MPTINQIRNQVWDQVRKVGDKIVQKAVWSILDRVDIAQNRLLSQLIHEIRKEVK